MEVCLFVSELRLSAFTSDRTGSNMPSMYAPWLPDVDWPGRSVDDVSSAVATAVTERGFFVVSCDRSRRQASDRGPPA